jgi:hypothetical protein
LFCSHRQLQRVWTAGPRQRLVNHKTEWAAMRYKRFSGSRANGKGRTNKLARAGAVRLQTRWVTEPDKQTKIETAGTSGVQVVHPSKHEREKEIRFLSAWAELLFVDGTSYG